MAKTVLLSGVMLAALANPNHLSAQEATNAAAVEEIIVTAQRRAERLENVPMSVTAVTAEAVAKAGVTNITELGSIAPGVQVNFGGGATQPAIRGITSLTNQVGNENNVAIYVDGFYATDMASINADFGNISSIEVLKGPQGTLYGRNATGGAILITTRAPSKTLTGKIEASYATFDDKTLSGYLSGPISESLRFSLAGYVRAGDGYIKFADPLRIGGKRGNASPLRQQSFRGKLEADLTDKLTATLGLNYGLSDDRRGNLFTTFAHIPATVAAPPLRATEYRTVSYNYGTENLATTREATLKLVYQTPIGTLSSYSGFSRRYTAQDYDFDGTYADVSSNQQRFVSDSYQQGVDFAINAIDKLDLIVGATYFDDVTGTRGPIERLTYGPGRVPASVLKVSLKTKAYAGYADATYRLTDALSVNLGGRFSKESKRVALEQTGSGAFPLTVKKETFSKFTPRASLRYEVAPRTNIYASYAKGFRSGTFPLNGPPATVLPIKPEIVESYEIGFKTAQANFRFDAAAFYSDDKDLHVSLTVPFCAGTICTIQSRFSNAPARVYGFEAQLSFTPVRRLNVRAGGAYVHARYRNFPNASGTGLNSVTDRNVSSQVQNWSGKQMARSPDFSGNLGIDYEAPLAGGELLLATNVSYTDSYVINNPSLFGPLATPQLAGKQRFRQKSHALLNGQATWTAPGGNFYIGIFGRNISNVKYRMTYNGGANGDYSTPAQPRQLGVKAGYQF